MQSAATSEPVPHDVYELEVAYRRLGQDGSGSPKASGLQPASQTETDLGIRPNSPKLGQINQDRTVTAASMVQARQFFRPEKAES